MEQMILDNLVQVFNDGDCHKLKYSSNIEMKYIYLYAFHYYGNGDKDNVIDVEDGADYTQKNMNAAYGFYFDEKTDNNTLDVLTTYYQKDMLEFDFEKAILRISTVEQMLFQYKHKHITAAIDNSKIKDVWENTDGAQPICIKYISNYKPSTKSEKEDIISKIQQIIKPKLPYVSISVIFEDDLEELVESNETIKDCVETGILILDKPNNYLSFGNEKSIVANVMASSIKKNYELYGKKGLFAKNLRLYVKSQKVDTGIEESIKDYGESFWYYNNGIIIICDNYTIKDNKIHLSNFSIINGGQTTRMIGETSFDKDFALTCKIIKNKYENAIEKTTFEAKIAEASNTQKPIKPTDLIANRIEQRLLKSQLLEKNVFVQIKRGEVANKQQFSESWQKTKNEDLAQLLFAGIYQQPGIARSNKKSLFENQQKYNTIFSTTYDSDLLIDLLYLKSHYKKWSKKVENTDIPNTDEEETKDFYRALKGLVKNGFYFVTASILLVAKIYYSSLFADKLKENLSNTLMFKSTYQSQTFNHRLFNCGFKESEDKIFKLFEYVTHQYLITTYQMCKDMNPALVYSNFTKTDSNYTMVVKAINGDYSINKGFPYTLVSLLDSILYKETAEDKKESIEMIDGISNSEGDNGSTNLLDSSENKELYELLKNYRKKEFMKRRIKAYYVFNDKELLNLVIHKPTTIMELSDYDCFIHHSDIKIKNYGKDIIDIISSFLSENLQK